jgi:hypothetical protein
MSLYDKNTSLSRAVVYLKTGERKVYYSFLREDKKGQQVGIGGLVRRIINEKHRGQYNTALIYNNPGRDEQPMHKYVEGRKEF